MCNPIEARACMQICVINTPLYMHADGLNNDAAANARTNIARATYCEAVRVLFQSAKMQKCVRGRRTMRTMRTMRHAETRTSVADSDGMSLKAY